MKTIEKIYHRLKRREKPTKTGFLIPTARDGVEGYEASVSVLTGGSVWNGGKFHREERFFTERQPALDWIEENVGDGKVLEITFSSAKKDFEETS